MPSIKKKGLDKRWLKARFNGKGQVIPALLLVNVANRRCLTDPMYALIGCLQCQLAFTHLEAQRKKYVVLYDIINVAGTKSVIILKTNNKLKFVQIQSKFVIVSFGICWAVK